MEEIVKDVINIGLGAAEKVKALAGGDTSALSGINVEELKNQGAANESEVANQLRTSVDNSLAQLEELRGKVETIVAEGQQKLSETLANLNLPAVSVDELRTNFDSYAAQVQEQLNTAFEQIKPMLDSMNIDELRTKVEEIISNIRGGQGGTA